MAFIKLTRDGDPVIINVNKIIKYKEHKDGAEVETDVYYMRVDESPEQITEKLIQAGEKVK